jgi:hypothetical protein
MGDRVSIQFATGKEVSVVLFNHWGGLPFVEEAKEYAKELIKEVGTKTCYPLERLEPNTVMVDFIRHITRKDERVLCSLYLGATSSSGDNSDNGHHVIHLHKKGVKEQVQKNLHQAVRQHDFM